MLLTKEHLRFTSQFPKVEIVFVKVEVLFPTIYSIINLICSPLICILLLSISTFVFSICM